MRVLFVNPFGGLGGSERSLLDTLASLQNSVSSVTLRLLLLGDGDLAERARALGVDVEVVPMPEALAALGESSDGANHPGARLQALLRGGFGALPYLATLRRATKAFEPHLVHTNGMKAHVLMAVATPELPRVVHLRDFASQRPLSRYVLRFVARGSLIVANSRAVERDARALIPGLRTRVVYNGIDLDEFRPAPCDREHLGTLAGLPPPAPNACLIGLVATYAWWKGHRTFIEAAARVHAKEPERAHRFYIVGGPIYGRSGSELSVDDLRRQITELGLERSVGLVPFQRDTAAAYRGLDIVVHASERPEPFGRTIVEGMATGRPVVVARGGGADELFTEGETALGHRAGSADDLSRALLTLTSDPALRERLSTRARTEAERRFDRRRLGAEIHTGYGELLGERLA
jgi:glycosyltransferase involved in cell wall biosynthesis